MKIKQKIEDIAYKCTFPYILLYLVYACINEMVFFASNLVSFNKYAYAILAFFGAILLAIDFFGQRRMLKTKHSGWLFLLVIALAVSTVMNTKYGFMDNIKTIIWTCIFIFLLYPFACSQTMENAKKQLKIIADILGSIWFLAVLISFIQFILQISYITEYSNIISRQGFQDGRLFGVFIDPNYAGITCACVIALSLFRIFNTKNKLIKTLFVINIIFQYIYIILCASRTVEIAGLMSLFFCLGFVIYKIFRSKNNKIIFSLFLAILFSLTCCVGLFCAINPVKKALCVIPNTISSTMKDPQHPDKKPTQIDTTRFDIDGDPLDSNNRFAIWSSAFDLWKTSPVYGTSPRNYLDYAKEIDPNGYIAQKEYSVHNCYLSVLVYSGIIGFVAMMGFALSFLVSSIKAYLKSRSKVDYITIACLMGVLFAFSIAGLSILMLVFLNSVREITFWLILGYLSVFLLNGEKSLPALPYRISEKILSKFKKGA